MFKTPKDNSNGLWNKIRRIRADQALRILGNLLVSLGLIGLLYAVYPVISHELKYELDRWGTAAREGPNINKSQTTPKGTGKQTSFGKILEITPSAPRLEVAPINKNNSIIIEKINVNAPIVWNVSVEDEKAYNKALEEGVAHANLTNKPSESAGNTYLFAHSTLNPLEIERYSAVFTLLHRLEIGDRITIFSNDRRFDYLVKDKQVIEGFNTTPLTRQPDYPMLTLQTCDPPGIPLNRLIITARLVGEWEIT